MNPSELILSPSRERLFRACKSPSKSIIYKSPSQNKTIIQSNKSPPKKETEELSHKEPEKRKQDFACDLIENFPVLQSHFEILKKVGEGTFSVVYLARLREDKSQMFALKYLVPTSSPGRIENELLCLQMLGGKNNVLPVKTTMRNGDHIIFVLPYFPHQRFSDFVRHMTLWDIQEYMWNLLVALKHVHRKNIIHRDVKPSNFLFSKDEKRYTLIDFGLAMSVPGCKTSLLKDYTVVSSVQLADKILSKNSGTQVNGKAGNTCKHPPTHICVVCRQRARQCAPRAGTSGFRSPEVLVRYPKQTTVLPAHSSDVLAVDMWSAGVILLCMLSRRYPFFKARDDMEALSQIMALVGTEKMKSFANTIGKEFVFGPAVEEVDSYKVMCVKLAQRVCPIHKQFVSNFHQEYPEKKGKRKRAEDYGQGVDTVLSKKSVSIVESQEPVDNQTHTNHVGLKNIETLDEINLINTTSDILTKTLTDAPTVSKMTETQPECDAGILFKNQSKDKTDCICIPDSAYNLLERLLELDPHKRITAEEALSHPFLSTVRSVTKHTETQMEL